MTIIPALRLDIAAGWSLVISGKENFDRCQKNVTDDCDEVKPWSVSNYS